MTVKKGFGAWALLAAGGLYGCALIAYHSVVIEGARRFILFDDAMISMRYARNLARGAGLVWNVGEGRVEGFTNLLWTLWMALLHAMGLSGDAVALGVQLSGLACLLGVMALLAFPRAGEPEGKAGLQAALAVLFCFPLFYWSCFGGEVGAVALAYGWGLMALYGGPAPKLGQACIAFSAALLLRQDAAAFIVPVWALGLRGPSPGRGRHALVGLALLVGALGLPTLWRHSYYGDWLPNTYYLKVSGIPLSMRLLRGAAVYGDFLLTALPFIVLGLIAAWKRAKDPLTVAAVAGFLSVSCYSIYVGGDAWEDIGGPNRFLAPAMPWLFLAAAKHWAGVKRGHWIVVLAWTWACLARGGIGLREQAFLGHAPYLREFEGLAKGGLLFQKESTPGLRLGVLSAGHLCYHSDRPCEDLLGKSDRAIAHGGIHPSVLRGGWRAFTPGHAKWDYAKVCGLAGPLLVLQIPAPEQGEHKLLLKCGFFASRSMYGPAYFKP